MAEQWDGKTKGSLWGYRFFTFWIKVAGVKFAYAFCYLIAGVYFLFFKKQRKNLEQFYRNSLGFDRVKARRMAYRNFNLFGRTLIDRIALLTNRRRVFSYHFFQEEVLREMHARMKGGFLFSAHVGNWENAGNLIAERITTTINILMLDAEVEKIKDYLSRQTGGARYNIIPLKEDLSHLVLVHQALKRNELIALHADRYQKGQKTYALSFLGKTAHFPAGPFIMAQKFKVPITFVFAVKDGMTHYELSASQPRDLYDTPEALAEDYVLHLEKLVRNYPEQWFNYFDFYADC